MTISIEGLRCETILGILPHERQKSQPITMDITATYTYHGHYLDYALIRQCALRTLREGGFGLIEEALAALFEAIKSECPAIETLRIKICKLTIFPDCRVCIEDFRQFL